MPLSENANARREFETHASAFASKPCINSPVARIRKTRDKLLGGFETARRRISENWRATRRKINRGEQTQSALSCSLSLSSDKFHETPENDKREKFTRPVVIEDLAPARENIFHSAGTTHLYDRLREHIPPPRRHLLLGMLLHYGLRAARTPRRATPSNNSSIEHVSRLAAGKFVVRTTRNDISLVSHRAVSRISSVRQVILDLTSGKESEKEFIETAKTRRDRTRPRRQK